MKILYLILIMFTTAFSQLEIEWDKTIGGVARDECLNLQHTNDGGYIFTGKNDDNLWYVKVDSVGDTLWTKTITIGDIASGRSIIQVSDSGYIIAGYSYTYNENQCDLLIVRCSSEGDTLWTKIYGRRDTDSGTSILETYDNGFVIAGFTTSDGTSDDDIWIIRTDNQGDTLWTKTINAVGNDNARSIILSSDSCYIVAGESLNTPSKFLLLKIDDSGNLIWNKPILGWSNYVFGESVIQIHDGSIICSGYHGSNAILMKTNSNGDLLWKQQYGGSENLEIYSIVQTLDGGYMLAGCYGYWITNKEILIIKTDENGIESWRYQFGGQGDDIGYSILNTDDGGFVIGGSTTSYGSGYWDAWLVKVKESLYSINTIDGHKPSSPIIKNYPNPFNNSTTFEIEIPETGDLQLQIFDIFGKKVYEEEVGRVSVAIHKIQWNGLSNKGIPVSSGIYFYRFIFTGKNEFNQIQTHKMMMLK